MTKIQEDRLEWEFDDSSNNVLIFSTNELYSVSDVRDTGDVAHTKNSDMNYQVRYCGVLTYPGSQFRPSIEECKMWAEKHYLAYVDEFYRIIKEIVSNDHYPC